LEAESGEGGAAKARNPRQITCTGNEELAKLKQRTAIERDRLKEEVERMKQIEKRTYEELEYRIARREGKDSKERKT
jgi:uncharacterized membrane protein